VFLESTNHLGRVLAKRKIHLVYGGGSFGLMGGCINSCIIRRQSSFGVVPKALAKRHIIGKTIREELQIFTMSDQLTPMFNHADVFITLPGGLGTLEEIFHISSWAQLNIHHKPIARQTLISAAIAEQLIDELQSFIPIVDSSMS